MESTQILNVRLDEMLDAICHDGDEVANVNRLCQKCIIASKSIVIYRMTWEALSPSPFACTLSGLTLLKLNYAALYPIAKGIWDCFSQNN